MEKVTSYSDFTDKARGKEKVLLLLYKSGSEQSDCSYKNIEEAFLGNEDIKLFSADVNLVKDIHTVYNITSVPSLLIIKDGSIQSLVKGCQDQDYYRTISGDQVFQSRSSSPAKVQKRVTVYSTPTCTWCTTLKAWLKKYNIHYTDIDVSRDHKAAEDLVRRSGQQGVPQTDIDGRIVVGFDQPKLKELLGVQ